MQMQPHILLAEDDADTSESIQLLLRRVGIQVSASKDSAEVSQLVATNHFDALLLDNWMPGP
jgi:CheY-like chemotaxis protein